MPNDTPFTFSPVRTTYRTSAPVRTISTLWGFRTRTSSGSNVWGSFGAYTKAFPFM